MEQQSAVGIPKPPCNHLQLHTEAQTSKINGILKKNDHLGAHFWQKMAKMCDKTSRLDGCIATNPSQNANLHAQWAARHPTTPHTFLRGGLS